MMRLQDSQNSTKSWTHTSAIFAHNNKTLEQIHPNPASYGSPVQANLSWVGVVPAGLSASVFYTVHDPPKNMYY
jgi:hypothetical protein